MRHPWAWHTALRAVALLAVVFSFACDRSNKACKEPPCEETCKNPPCNDTCKEPPCNDTCKNPPCDDTCKEPPCDDTCKEPPCGTTCKEPPCEEPGKPWTQWTFTPEDVAALKTRKIFFAHKSVGGELMEGIRRVDGMNVRGVFSSQLNQVGTQIAFYEHNMFPPSPDNPQQESLDPYIKIETFERLMHAIGEAGNTVDIAFMKMGYPNFNDNSNVGDIFEAYQTTLQRLQDEFPNTIFVHATAPIYMESTATRPIFNLHNVQIERFNKRLRDIYKGKVFDLATLESIREDGSIAKSTDGETIALAEEWSSDGGHLNVQGQNRFGGALIGFLAQVK